MVKNRATQPNSSIVCFMSVAVHVIEGVNKKGFFRQLNLTQLNIYILEWWHGKFWDFKSLCGNMRRHQQKVINYI